MSVSTFPHPAQLKERLEVSLAAALGTGLHEGLHVGVSRRDERGRKAPSAAKAAYYELAIFYNGAETRAEDPFRLDAIEDAIRQIPGVYRTTRVSPDDHGFPAGIDDPGWPVYRSRTECPRPSVLALLRDPEVS